ncbi:prolipoprotein diacylglyceryl transferase family protein, partial [candidate division KSB1 bacterium]
SWGLMVVIGSIFGGYYIYRKAQKSKHYNLNIAMLFLLSIFVGGFAGARILHFYGPWGVGSFWERTWDVLGNGKSGWVGYGMMLGGAVGSFIFCRIKISTYEQCG